MIDRLIESLDNLPADEGIEAAWGEEIRRRVDDIRSGRVKGIPGEQVLREIAEEFPMGSSRFLFHPEAREEIRGAIRWYRPQSLLASSEFRAAVSDAIRLIVDAPQRWPKYIYGTRWLVLRRFPFSVVTSTTLI